MLSFPDAFPSGQSDTNIIRPRKRRTHIAEFSPFEAGPRACRVHALISMVCTPHHSAFLLAFRVHLRSCTSFVFLDALCACSSCSTEAAQIVLVHVRVIHLHLWALKGLMESANNTFHGHPQFKTSI